MADDVTQTERPPKRHVFRKAFWLFMAGVGILVLMNVFFPDLDLSSEDRIALIRVEGVILDSQTTVGELKRFSENPSIKAIVLRIDTPGGGVILFQGMADHNAESVKSLDNCNIAWVEEAQSPSNRSLALLRPTIRAEKSQIWFSWNPRRKSDAVDQFFRGAVQSVEQPGHERIGAHPELVITRLRCRESVFGLASLVFVEVGNKVAAGELLALHLVVPPRVPVHFVDRRCFAFDPNPTCLRRRYEELSY